MNSADVVLYGPAYSTYTRTARLALEEKAARYRLVEVDFLRGANKSSEHLARHPFGKVPVLEHGEVTLYETIAITDYIDSTFPGHPLQPTDASGRARTLQAIGILMSYIYGPMVGQIIVERMIKPILGQPADEAVAQSGAHRLRKGLAVLEALMGNSPFLNGKSFSLADLYLIPMWAYFIQTPEGKAAMPTVPCLEQWWQAMSARPSVVNTAAVVQ